MNSKLYYHFGIEFDEGKTPKHITKDNFVNKELPQNQYLTNFAKDQALKNYSLNMQYFRKLDEESFNIAVRQLLKIAHFINVSDLNVLKGKKGIYILVLDKYKQLYIGQSFRDLKERIIRHFKITIPYQRVPFIINDTLPIDAFKPLDTTRIFVLLNENQDILNEIEGMLISNCPKQFMLNKTIGGKSNTMRDFAIRLSTGRIKKPIND